MKLTSLAMPGIALGAAALFILPEQSEAYSLLGFSLGVGQLDVRVFNNFSDPSDNNNQTPNPDFPAYFGADMAIWKGAQEWSSEQYGAAFTDPHQQYLGGDVGGTELGNFDITWQGSAIGIGGVNDNIQSQISGSNGGVLAFTESPSSNGWRIRYYEGWNWADGPGASVSGIDLQAVACHEYGHALGMGHSGNSAATMFASGGGVGGRSINVDDKNGLKAIYGAADANKPHISSFVLNGTSLTVTGTDFSPANNRVWFTQAGAGGTGAAVKVTGLTSNGTTLSLAVPGNAGPGMILMRNDTVGTKSMSNAVPLDPGNNPTFGNIYCDSEDNSSGSTATLAASGSDVVADNNLQLLMTDGPPNQFGYYLMSSLQGFVPLFSGSQGNFCLGAPFIRFSALGQNTTAGGEFAFQPDLTNLPQGALINPGETWNFQVWFRDINGNSNTSDGLEIPFQ
jgi:hypothetical protein